MLGFFSRKAGETPPESTKPVLLVTLFGISSEAQPEILQVISGKFHQRFRIVYCITTDDFSAFLRHGVVCETFPSLENQRHHHDLLDWPPYLTSKWALVIEKWKPAKILAYGMNFDRYIDASKAAAQTGGSL